MQIGEVIRKYRKDKNMTQEEMAKRLGVTTPAVNKWEKGVTQPDIMLLAPIARLLGITLETLLSFHDELAQGEITSLVEEVAQKLDDESYDDVFRYVSGIIQEYPNCHQLIWQMAVVLDARCMTDEAVNADDYDEQILKWYQCALESNDVKLQKSTADSLFHYYVRKDMYDKAEEYLQYFAEEDTNRKRMQALIYSKTNRLEEAYKAYEEILFSECNLLSMVFHSLFILSAEEGKMAQAQKYLEKESSLNRLFEMGKYREISCKLEMVVQDKDVEETLLTVKTLLDCVESIGGFTDSWLYAHMRFKELPDGFVQKVRNDLLGYFSDKETFGYMDGNAEWDEMICGE
ncbi:MAG: helix-turn-helix domain-containing protein [Lachnospiraceae bacterium]|nr:helix-turn-helix domain-containing protein [Lachnospiraceae bacterium]